MLSVSGTPSGLIVEVHSVVFPRCNPYSFFCFLYFSLTSRVCYCWNYSDSSPKFAFSYCCYNNLVSFVYKEDITSFFTFYFSMLLTALPKFGDGWTSSLRFIFYSPLTRSFGHTLSQSTSYLLSSIFMKEAFLFSASWINIEDFEPICVIVGGNGICRTVSIVPNLLVS